MRAHKEETPRRPSALLILLRRRGVLGGPLPPHPCLTSLEESWPGDKLKATFRGHGQLVERPYSFQSRDDARYLFKQDRQTLAYKRGLGLRVVEVALRLGGMLPNVMRGPVRFWSGV